MMLMSKIPYKPEKKVAKAKKKFMKMLKKDRAAELVYVRDLDIEQEIRAYYKEEVPKIDEKIELEILEAMKRKEEAKSYIKEKLKAEALESVEAERAMEALTPTTTETAESTEVVENAETPESGDREQ